MAAAGWAVEMGGHVRVTDVTTRLLMEAQQGHDS